jgi:dTDP-4-dehydrorhamnose reductase
MKVLVLGDGLLGNEIVNQTGWDFVSRKKHGFSIKNFDNFITKEYDVVLNCIANTNTYSEDRESHWEVNCVFVDKLIDFCNRENKKLVHISTDYIYTNSVENASEDDVPVHCNNWYGYTKLVSDSIVQIRSNNYLIIRCTHKPKPFPYSDGWIDQVGNFDYVDTISSIIINLIKKDLKGVYNVGTKTKTMYELAKITKDVKGVKSPNKTPKNTSMNLNKLELIK